MRDRSSWDRNTLSYCGRNRIGTGTSSAAMTPSSTSNSSRPASSRYVRRRGRSRSMTSRRPVSHDQMRMSLTVAGPNTARYRSTRSSMLGMVDHRSAEPALGGRVGRTARPAPQPARRDLDKRQQEAGRVGERRRVAIRPCRSEGRPELRRRHRLLLKDIARAREDGVEVDPDEPLRERAAAPGPGHDVGQDRVLRQGIPRRDEMERAPQVAHADGLALLDRTAQLRRIEPIDPRPQSDIRVGRFLRLHADQVLDHLERRPPDPLDQELPGEQGAVEGAAREHRSFEARAAVTSGWPARMPPACRPRTGRT